DQKLKYSLTFTGINNRAELINETIENSIIETGNDEPYFYYRSNNRGHPTFNVVGETSKNRQLRREDIDTDQSILAQRRDPDIYPEITYMAKKFPQIHLYRDWILGRNSTPRLPQKLDGPTSYLLPDCSNLVLLLSQILKDNTRKKKILSALNDLNPAIEDVGFDIVSSTGQIFFNEDKGPIPATRLSDGTLRYLVLLTILLNPNPASLICIEEPELGLHPDVLPTVAKLLQEASLEKQLIVTTHSDILIDALSETPQSVIVCESSNHGTQLHRLNEDNLKPFLKDYRLGELWMSGELGGTRW
ncbi:MAG: AAA family ATPase, partial [Candidatus Adiutrix sp.]